LALGSLALGSLRLGGGRRGVLAGQGQEDLVERGPPQPDLLDTDPGLAESADHVG